MTDREPTILEQDDGTPDGLRATIARQNENLEKERAENAENAAYRRKRELKDSGLDGPALKAVEKDLKRGEYEGEVTGEGLRKYAEEEYDWKPPSDDDKPDDDPPKVDDATQARLDAQKTRDDLGAASHARGDGEDDEDALQASADKKLDEGDVQGAVLDELNLKVNRAQ